MNQGKIGGKDFFVSDITDCLDYVRKYMGDDFYRVFHAYLEGREEQLTAQIDDAEEELDNRENYPKRRKTPNFSYGDIRRVRRIYVSN